MYNQESSCSAQMRYNRQDPNFHKNLKFVKKGTFYWDRKLEIGHTTAKFHVTFVSDSANKIGKYFNICIFSNL